MNTPDLLNRLADIVSRLRHMWDDTDGDTHMPVEESDDISAVGTDIATSLACADQWMDIAGAIRSHAATIDHAERVESETDAALIAAVTAAHAGDLGAASDAATCALALLGLDSAFRVRVERADSLAPGLPEGWEVLNGVITYPDAKRITAHGPVGACVTLAIRPDGIRWQGHAYAPPAVYAYLLARAQGVGS